MFGKKRKSKKILETAYPVLASYPHIAGIQAMLGNSPYTMPLVMSELVELTFDREIDRLDFSVALEIAHYINNYPMVYSHGLSRGFVEKKWGSVALFLKDVIDDGYYVQMLVDTYYISAYKETYGKQHFNHNIMIYGYDEYEEVFYVSDCFVGGRYDFNKCSFSQMEDAFIHTYRNDWINGIRLFKVKEETYVGIGYNTDYIISACRRYLTGKRSNVATYTEGRRRIDQKDRFVDGIGIYDELVSYVDDWQEDEGWRTYDIRIFYVLYDHARLFTYMTRQLMQRNQMVNAPRIYDKFRDIENRIKNLYMMVLKYNVNGSEKTRNLLKEMLMDIKAREADAIEDFMENADVTKEDMEREKKVLARPDEAGADSIFVEYDDENHWKKKNINDTVMYTNVSGACVRVAFYGTGVRINVVRKKSFGQADLYVDGEKKCTIDYSDTDGEDVVHICGSDKGYHLLRLENISKNGESINLGNMEFTCTAGGVDAVCSEARVLEFKKGIGADLIKEYEKAGYDIAGYKRKLPEYLTDVTYTFHNAITVLLINDMANDRGVKKSKGRDDRVAAYQLSDTELWIEMTVPGVAREVGFYSVDYDGLGRAMEVSVEDADSGKTLCSQKVSNFTDGVLVKFSLKGHVNVRFKRLEGPDAVLNAVWFG